MEETNLKKEIISWIMSLVMAFAVAFLIVTFVGQRVTVDGHSMEATLQDRDNLICDKLSYRFGDPERYDIVVIFPDDTKSKRWIKRVIGLPGETISIEEDGDIIIDGEVLDEHYGREVIEDAGDFLRVVGGEYTLGEDEYWCMGDNRNHSTDSRWIGPVPKKRIIGKAFVRIYPFSKFGMIKHK